jgi:hypothetical protein
MRFLQRLWRSSHRRTLPEVPGRAGDKAAAGGPLPQARKDANRYAAED